MSSSPAAPMNETKDWLSQPNVLEFGGSNRSASLNTLDNFYVLPMSIPVPYSSTPQTFSSIEHYFQAAKFFNFDNEWADQVRQAKDGKEAQTRGRERRLPREKLDEWKEGASSAAMRVALRHKYVLQSEKEAAKALLGTQDKTLVERVTDDPTWDDKLVSLQLVGKLGYHELITYGAQWGAGKDGVGINRMGVLLMEARTDLRKH